VACGTATKLTAVWKAPEAAGTRFKKVIVAAQTKDQASRRSMESHWCRASPTDGVLRGADRRRRATSTARRPRSRRRPSTAR
jgi:hypothetical protein